MTTMETPRTLTFRFHEFRPSDRKKLKETIVLDGGPQAFEAALRLYLVKWAEATWLTEYDIERIGKWTAIHFPDVAKAVVTMCRRELAGAQNEQAKKTYAVMIDEIQKHLSLVNA